jgi:hypothetical protein
MTQANLLKTLRRLRTIAELRDQGAIRLGTVYGHVADGEQGVFGITPVLKELIGDLDVQELDRDIMTLHGGTSPIPPLP